MCVMEGKQNFPTEITVKSFDDLVLVASIKSLLLLFEVVLFLCRVIFQAVVEKLMDHISKHLRQ